ncbi:MAG: hypothetical protein ABIJ43_00135 [Candidatus Beckwithbacteria bacterium]|nr:hypothetical protein [Patescibacteria group bacterium]
MALTKQDLNQIEGLLDLKLDEKFLAKIDNLIDKRFKLLPTKDEFFTKMDEVVGELETTRQEQTILGYQVSEHEKRIIKLEEQQPENGQMVAMSD